MASERESLLTSSLLAQTNARFIKPKAWGWRFIGADIQMANGQLVECYVVFTQMDDVKKHARHPDLSPVSNHEIYENWRAKDPAELTRDDAMT